jgi:hypothetical protein
LNWFDYWEASYRTEKQKIIFVGTLLEGLAADWFFHRQENLSSQFLTDNWNAFLSVMDTQFIDENEEEDLLTEMKKVRYDGDIDAYLTTFCSKNLRLGLHGTYWKELLRYDWMPVVG